MSESEGPYQIGTRNATKRWPVWDGDCKEIASAASMHDAMRLATAFNKAHAAALASSKLEDKAVSFLKRAADGNHRIVSTGDLTIHQIAEARANGMMFVDEGSNLGWVLLPWALTTAKDEQRNAGRAEGAKL